MENINVAISSEALSVESCYQFVLNPECGGNALFVGTVRNQNLGKEVTHLEFECYESMALKELSKIAHRAIDLFGIHKISMHHRVGKVELEGIAVVIAVSSKHRKAAFEACEFAIDELKKTVPIWKKEFWKGGDYWVGERP